jgi:GT2 family glycosyltransferase/glycosyltransferase involved in cell wall biosynthesis
MRILQVVHGFPPAAQGGTELYARAHARTLREAGDDVLVFTREQNSSQAEYAVRADERDGLRIVSVNNTFRETRSFEETYRNEAIGAIGRDLIDEFHPDVAHIHHLTGLSTTIVHALAERRIPVFFTLHDYWLMCHRGQLLDVNYHVCEWDQGVRTARGVRGDRGVRLPPSREPSADCRSLGVGGQADHSGSQAGCHACLGAAGGAGAMSFGAARGVRALERWLRPAPAQQLRGISERIAAMISSPAQAQEQERRRNEHMREVCGRVTHFFAPSRYIRDRFVQFGVAPERITVAPNGVEGTIASYVGSGFSRTSGNRPLRLGFAGSLMVSKAPHVLLEAVDRLPSGAVSVDLFGAYAPYHGDDRYQQRLGPLLHRPGVRVHGAIPHEQMAGAFGSIDLLVVPSIWPENSPLVIQEAFLAGVPVVASRIGGIPELVTEGRNGLLFRAGDAEELSKTLIRFLNEPELLERLRAGIPAVPTIHDDVRFARNMYERSVCRGPLSRLAAIVLNYRTPDETYLAVKALLASSRRVDQIIVVNNDSLDETRDALDTVSSKITYIHTSSNLGFSGGINVGVRAALSRGADRVLLVNSDLIVPPDAIERLEQCLDADPRAGIAGPVVLARAEPDKIASLGISYAPGTGRMRHVGNGARINGREPLPAHQVVDAVSGCLMLIKREVFEAVGLLSEDYYFTFEDLDFCLRARQAGFRTIVTRRATVYHEGGQSLGARSPRRFYYAARNHLLLARRAEPSAGALASLCRTCSIVMLNLVHAVVSPGGSLPVRVAAVARGTRDYVAGRFGAVS